MTFLIRSSVAMIALLGMGLVAVQDARAEDAAPAAATARKFGVVNLEGIMHEAKAAKSVHDQIEALRKKYQDEIGKQEKDLKTKDQELADQRSVMTQEAFDEARRDFRTKVASAQHDVQVKRAQLDRAYAKALTKIQMTLAQIVEGIAKEKGFEVVFPSSQLLYADETLNVSEEVLKRLDKELSSVEVKIEPLPEGEEDKESK